ncbi:hypothetical protein Ancab_005299 [Ancistrocladus abbreviatus]
MATTSTLILSVKLILISTGVLIIAMLLTFSLPQFLNLAASELPNMWSFLRSWLRPPYLYVIINGIIISIVASSLLHRHQHNYDDAEHLLLHQHAPMEVNYTAKLTSSPVENPAVDVDLVRSDDANRFGVHYDALSVKDVEVVDSSILTTAFQVTEASADVVNCEEEVNIGDADGKCGVVDDGEDAVVGMSARSTCTLSPPPPAVRQESSDILSDYLSSTVEKLPVSATARFSHHRRPVRAVPEGGKALGVAKPKRHETLESTWKAITEGRHIPLVRHLKKSDTWENHNRQINSSNPSPQLAHKSETFKDRTNYSPPAMTVSPPLPPPSSARLKKEPSLSQDELNRRVEAFIKKFNEEMRLQRQRSLQQYMEMIDRAA